MRTYFDILNRLCTNHECKEETDRRTDRQTEWHVTITRSLSHSCSVSSVSWIYRQQSSSSFFGHFSLYNRQLKEKRTNYTTVAL